MEEIVKNTLLYFLPLWNKAMFILGGGAKLLFDLLFRLRREINVDDMGMGDGFSLSDDEIDFVKCLDDVDLDDVDVDDEEVDEDDKEDSSELLSLLTNGLVSLSWV